MDYIDDNDPLSLDATEGQEQNVTLDPSLSTTTPQMGVSGLQLQMQMDILDMMDDDGDNESPWGGSPLGKSPNKKRDFVGAHQRIVEQYFKGEDSVYDEIDFERRFRMPRKVFSLLWEQVQGVFPFVQQVQHIPQTPGISPLVRFCACLRKLCYGDSSDREDEKFEISETSVNNSFKEMCRIIKTKFAGEYLNRCPTANEVKRAMNINKKRGFPGLFASWDCKHFRWNLCPNALAGQHHGKETGNTLVLEAICDPDLYIWYSFFGSPGSLNDLNVLDRSTIVQALMDGSFNIKLPPDMHYKVNGTIRDWLYFLVDGIYPPYPFFIDTISGAQPNTKQSNFAKTQESVRKDIERAFGVLVKRFELLNKAFRNWSSEDITDVIDCAIIIHNMIVQERRSQYLTSQVCEEQPTSVSNAVAGDLEEIIEDPPVVTLFAQEEQGQLALGSEATQFTQQQIAGRAWLIDEGMKNVEEHMNLKFDLMEEMYRNDQHSE